MLEYILIRNESKIIVTSHYNPKNFRVVQTGDQTFMLLH